MADEQSSAGDVHVNQVTLADIYNRLGALEVGQTTIHTELASLTTEVRTGLNGGGKSTLRERVRILESRWNRLVGGLLLLGVGVGAFEALKYFLS